MHHPGRAGCRGGAMRAAGEPAEIPPLSGEALERLVEVLVDRRRDLTREQRRTIRSGLRIPGFKDPLKAPASLLTGAFREATRHPEALRVLVGIWASLEEELVRRVGQVGEGEDTACLAHFDPRDVEIAGWWHLVTRRPPSPPQPVQSPSEASAASPGTLPEPLAGILADLERLPPDHPAWDRVDEFVTGIREVAAARRAERDVGAVRQALAEALAVLRPGDLDPKYACWSADACPPERIREALDRVRQLQRLLGEHRDAETQLSRATSVAEKSPLLERLSEMNRTIMEAAGELDALLGGSPPPEPPSPAPVGEGPALAVGGEAAGYTPEVSAPEPGDVSPAVEAREAAGVPARVVSVEVPSVQAASSERVETEALPPAGVVEHEHPSPSSVVHLARLMTARDGGLEAAWWYARALEVLEGKSAVPSALLAVCAAARWILHWPELASSAAFMTELQTEIGKARTAVGDGGDGPLDCLRLASAIPLALFHPETGLFDWLEPPADLPGPVRELAERIREYCLRVGQPPAVKEREHSTEETEAEIRAHIAAVEKWYAEALERKVSPYTPACRVFWELLKDDTPRRGMPRQRSQSDNVLYRCLAPVLEDRRSEVGDVLRRAADLEDQSTFDQVVQRVNLRLSQRHSPRDIEAKALLALRREAQEVAALARRWAELVKLHERVRRIRRDQIVEQSSRLARFLDDRVSAAVGSLVSGCDPSSLVTAARALLARCLEDLPARLRGHARGAGPRPACLREGLGAGLAYRLLLLDIPLVAAPAGTPEPAEEGWVALRRALESLEPETDADPYRALQWRLQTGDLRWTVWLFDELVPAERPRIIPLLKKSFEEHEHLLSRAEVVRREVELGAMEGGVQPEERAELLAEVENVQRALGPASGPTGALPSDEAGVRERLRGCQVHLRDLQHRLGRVSARLEELRNRTLEHHRRLWESLKPSVESILPSGEFGRVEALVSNGLEGRRTILLNEFFARAEVAARWKAPEELMRFLKEAAEPEPVRQHLQSFLQAREDIFQLLEREGLRGAYERATDGSLRRVVRGTHIPREAVEQFRRAVRAWGSLKDATAGAEDPRDVMLVLDFLGLRPPGRHDVDRMRRGRGWSLYRTTWTGEAPVPEFGSEAGPQLPVLLVWERPSAETMESVLVEAGLQDPRGGLVVLYLGQLRQPLLENLAGWAYRRRLPWLAVDESLLVYLHGQRERLLALFSCALPYSGLNPYRPDHEVNLPPEMFVGRQHQVRQLLDEAGPNYVYGGRKLGKSSLLGQVRRRFHAPEDHRYAVVLQLRDLRTRPDPAEVWPLLVSRLVEEASLDRPRATHPKDLAEHLARLLRRRRDLRLMALLDESDEFLELDARQGFPNVSRLYTLMHETGRRFRVVFAGLRTVRRFQRLPNHPLVGESLTVGPLEPHEARELMQNRMAMLGIQLDHDALLYLLALTNYHAGLLQALGRRIVEAARQSGTLPPFWVRYHDVERISRELEVQRMVVDRFHLTLGLDRHYEILVLGMVLDQLQTPDGFSKTYQAEDLRDIGLHHWPAGFGGMTLQEVRDCADELTEMAVLSRAGEHSYRLRTPNIVRLLGTRAEMEDRIMELASRPAEPPPSAELHPLVGQPPVPGPFSHRDLLQLGVGRSGVSVVIGSVATGRRDVEKYLRALVTARPDRPRLDSFLVGRAGADPLAELVPEDRHLVLVSFDDADADTVDRYIRTAVGLTGRTSARGWLRVLFLLDPPAADRWASRLESVPVDGTVVLAPWSEGAIAKALEALELPADAATDIASRTSGYHCFVAEILEAAIQHRQVRGMQKAVRRMESGLAPGGELFGRLAQFFELTEGSACWRAAVSVAQVLRPWEPEDRGTLAELVAEVLGIPAEGAHTYVRCLEVRGVLIETGSGVALPGLVHAWLTDTGAKTG